MGGRGTGRGWPIQVVSQEPVQGDNPEIDVGGKGAKSSFPGAPERPK